MSEYCLNPYHCRKPCYQAPEFAYLSAIGAQRRSENDTAREAEEPCGEVLAFHRGLPGYAVTPLRSMPETARTLGVAEISVKDESRRFGLDAFKPLGASFAVYRYLKRLYRERFAIDLTPGDFARSPHPNKLGPITFCAATDGNHGRAVAWIAKQLGHRSVIFMPASTAAARVESVRSEGGQVVLVEGSFDDCVERCSTEARGRGWTVVADTGYPGYLEVPQDIILGYTTIFAEADVQLAERDRAFRERQPAGRTPAGPATGDSVGQDSGVDIVLVQTGVGGLAAAAVAYHALRYRNARPVAVCIEPTSADGFLQSIKAGRPVATTGALDSAMAGLNCGIPSLAAWPIINHGVRAFVAIEDEWAFRAMRRYAQEGIVSGESGAAGLAGLLAISEDPHLRPLKRELGMTAQTRVLLVNTEGATDPPGYRRIVGHQPAPAGRRYGG